MRILTRMWLLWALAILLGAAVLGGTTLLDARLAAAQAPNHGPRSKCTFSDGGTLVVGRESSAGESLGAVHSSDGAWRAGEYATTTLQVSEPMLIPPLDTPLKIPTGSYTLFVKDQGNPPWTLIVSRKTGEWGMAYPGERYDLGRADMGSDVRPAVENFHFGCINFKDTGDPIFLWMQSGRRVAYVKVLAVKTTDGKTEYLMH